MSQAALRRDARYTYADYRKWSDDERWELICGVAYNMTPAPSRAHQKISKRLLVEFEIHLRGRKCEVYGAPFDVRLPKPGESDETTNTVVQPDLVVVCDPAKLMVSQKVRTCTIFVIPAKAGIQEIHTVTVFLDPGFCRGDDFLRVHQSWTIGAAKVRRTW